MVEKTAVIRNAQGIHCRPAAVIVKELRGAQGELAIEANGQASDPRSIMSLLSMGLQKGDRVIVRVVAPDERALCRKLVDLLETRFDFPPRKPGEVIQPESVNAPTGRLP